MPQNSRNDSREIFKVKFYKCENRCLLRLNIFMRCYRHIVLVRIISLRVQYKYPLLYTN